MGFERNRAGGATFDKTFRPGIRNPVEARVCVKLRRGIEPVAAMLTGATDMKRGETGMLADPADMKCILAGLFDDGEIK
jgi:hypothetical protein